MQMFDHIYLVCLIPVRVDLKCRIGKHAKQLVMLPLQFGKVNSIGHSIHWCLLAFFGSNLLLRNKWRSGELIRLLQLSLDELLLWLGDSIHRRCCFGCEFRSKVLPVELLAFNKLIVLLFQAAV